MDETTPPPLSFCQRYVQGLISQLCRILDQPGQCQQLLESAEESGFKRSLDHLSQYVDPVVSGDDWFQSQFH